MRILFVSAELAPLCQSGGLGDAVAGLARALAERGHEVTCALPAYRLALQSRSCPALRPGSGVSVRMPGGDVHGRWLFGELFAGVRLALLDVPALFDREGIYADRLDGTDDQARRFIALSWAAAYLCEQEPPDVVVAHDWHAALSICALRTALDRGPLREVGTVLVVHNNAYQGRFSLDDMALTRLPPELLHPDGLEAYGSLCLLKGGLMWADRLVTVSPTYAREVQGADAGQGLEGAYRRRAHRLSGIVNGIDLARFDPASDAALVAPFSAEDPGGKAPCRAAVLDELRLEAPAPGRFLVAIGRFVQQKGWDLIADVLDELVAGGASIALLGDGDPHIAEALRQGVARHPRQVALRFGYDDRLARRLYAGADAVLVPSRFEPCGLVQQIAQRYGTLPIAHAVGGLVDTIVDDSLGGSRGAPDWRQNTGLLFAPLGKEPLLRAVEAVAALGASPDLARVQRRLLGLDLSWGRSAAAFEQVCALAAREGRARR